METMLPTAVPFTVTPVAELRLVPVIVIWVPTGPPEGVKPVMVGVDPSTVKFGGVRLPVLAVPPEVITVIRPAVAFAGTETTIEVELQLLTEATTPLNLTVLPD